jgi:hypothetical protein
MLKDPGYNDDPNRPFGYHSRRLATDNSPLRRFHRTRGDCRLGLSRNLLLLTAIRSYAQCTASPDHTHSDRASTVSSDILSEAAENHGRSYWQKASFQLRKRAGCSSPTRPRRASLHPMWAPGVGPMPRYWPTRSSNPASRQSSCFVSFSDACGQPPRRSHT